MDSRQFYDLTVKVRRLQREYFKTRDKEVLTKSKAAESELDREINRVNAIKGLPLL